MRKFVKFLIWTAIVIGGLIGLARLTAIRWWKVPENDPLLGASITPSLYPGDTILLWRLSEPSYGDLVLCPDPTDPNEVVIGRIVGETGDDIRVQGNDLWVNRSPMRTEMACTERTFKSEDPNTGNAVEQYCDQEDLGGRLHMRGNITAGRSQSSQLVTEQKVGEGKVFLLSDNRLYPFDSRRYGQVDRATCKETVFFRLTGKNGFFDVKRRLTFIH
ncbi:MAG: signal peptidase I [Myxococcales bacterium]|nr:signal peptidase I [Myxococcales bacterium]